MQHNELSTAIRFLLVCGALNILLFTVWHLFAMWKEVSRGEKLFMLGTIMFQVYVADALRETIQLEYPLRLRLVALLLGEILFLAYYLLPYSARLKSCGAPYKHFKFPDKNKKEEDHHAS